MVTDSDLKTSIRELVHTVVSIVEDELREKIPPYRDSQYAGYFVNPESLDTDKPLGQILFENLLNSKKEEIQQSEPFKKVVSYFKTDEKLLLAMYENY